MTAQAPGGVRQPGKAQGVTGACTNWLCCRKRVSAFWGCAGHAGSRIGWALVGDPALAQLMRTYLQVHGGLPSESQARAAALLEYVLSTRGGTSWNFCTTVLGTLRDSFIFGSSTRGWTLWCFGVVSHSCRSWLHYQESLSSCCGLGFRLLLSSYELHLPFEMAAKTLQPSAYLGACHVEGADSLERMLDTCRQSCQQLPLQYCPAGVSAHTRRACCALVQNSQSRSQRLHGFRGLGLITGAGRGPADGLGYANAQSHAAARLFLAPGRGLRVSGSCQTRTAILQCYMGSIPWWHVCRGRNPTPETKHGKSEAG